MKIEQLEQLIKIVECGSMNTAAEEMYLARSSLSTSMKRLEEELGEPVFIRHSNGVNLTPFGSTVYNHAREICSRIQFLRGIISKSSDRWLHVASMYCSMANAAFADFLRMHKNESIEASIEEVSLQTVLDLVSEGICEVGIITLFSDTEEVTLRKLEQKNLAYHEIAQRQLGAMVGRNNPLYGCESESIELQELVKYPHLENYATPTDHAWEHRMIPEGYPGRYVVSDLGLALRLVSETDAVMIDSNDDEIYKSFYGENSYRFIPIRDYPKCKTGWIQHKALQLSPLAQEFVEILTKTASAVS
ncbi:MAG: LysR family transcriptional regulator [Oscillospiraceae bacterium]|nr:LysR family transcriptional regulator [Oscillospiraceae bacterium]